MKILITGANGFIGKKLIDFLSKDNQHKITALVRSKCDQQTKVNVEYKVGDLLLISDWDWILNDVDIVIHAAGRAHIMDEKSHDSLSEFRRINTFVTINLSRECLLHGIKRFIYISTVKVLGEYTEDDLVFSSESKPCPSDPYAISKYEAETSLNENKELDTVIIRPPLVYGSGVKGNLKKLLRLVKGSFPLPFGSIKNSRSMVSVENLIDLIVNCIHNPNAKNKTFLVSDESNLSTPELISLIAKTGGHKSKLIKCPLPLLKFVLFCSGKISVYDRLCRSMQVNIDFTKEQLNWSPKCSIEDSMIDCWKEKI